MNTPTWEEFQKKADAEDQTFRNCARLSRGLLQVCRRDYLQLRDDTEQHRVKLLQALDACYAVLQPSDEPVSVSGEEETPKSQSEAEQAFDYLEQLLQEMEQSFFRIELLLQDLCGKSASGQSVGQPDTQAILEKLDLLLNNSAPPEPQVAPEHPLILDSVDEAAHAMESFGKNDSNLF